MKVGDKKEHKKKNKKKHKKIHWESKPVMYQDCTIKIKKKEEKLRSKERGKV
jgi:hypothetical protein